MNKKNTDKLYHDFAQMFSQHTWSIKDSAMPWGFDCNDGWFKLIYDTCKKISSHIGDDFAFVQVKEKYGGLRMYYDGKIDGIGEAIITDAEEKSEKICEVCGKKGELRENKSHWLKTRCDKCWVNEK